MVGDEDAEAAAAGDDQLAGAVFRFHEAKRRRRLRA